MTLDQFAENLFNLWVELTVGPQAIPDWMEIPGEVRVKWTEIARRAFEQAPAVSCPPPRPPIFTFPAKKTVTR